MYIITHKITEEIRIYYALLSLRPDIEKIFSLKYMMLFMKGILSISICYFF